MPDQNIWKVIVIFAESKKIGHDMMQPTDDNGRINSMKDFKQMMKMKTPQMNSSLVQCIMKEKIKKNQNM